MTSTTFDTSPKPGGDPLRQLQRRFLLGMLAIAMLVGINQVVLQPWLIQLTSDAPVINFAGRQRMLSQRISKAALKVSFADSLQLDADGPRREMTVALDEWTRAHRGLQYGDESLRLPANTDDDIGAAFADLEPHFQAMQSAAGTLLKSEANEPELRAAVDRLLAEEQQYLPRMDAVVGMFESESSRRVASLRRAGWVILVAVLALLGALIRFSIGPVLRIIEIRVAERTERLRLMNEQLEREITDRRHAEGRTRELLEQLAHASRLNSLGQMAASLAHELNQPLGAIANYAEAARISLDSKQTPPADIEPLLKKITAAGLRAGSIVHRLRNFIRNVKSPAAQVHVGELIGEVIELCRPEARKCDVLIEFEQPGSASPVTPMDAIQIQQVLVNLIHNGIQAMDATPREDRTIRVSLTTEEDELRIDVADCGCGFSRDNAESLFEPFVTTKAEGLGMGLAICRSIVQEHGGRLWAVAPAEGGAVFSFTLPLETRHEPADCLSRR